MKLAAVLAPGLAAAALMLAVDNAHGAWLTLVVLGGVGLAALALVEILVRRRRGLGPLRNQLAIAVAVPAAIVLVAVGVFAAVMFVGPHTAVVVAIVSGFAGVVGALAGRRLVTGVLADVDAVRDGLVAIGDGRRDVHVATGGDDELAELAEAANDTIDRLAAEEGARRTLVAAVSHDLRTPLTSLRLLAAAVEDDIVGGEERSRYLAEMRTHLEALGGLVDDLFELARLEAGDIAWTVQQVELADLVTDTVDAMRAQARVKGVDVRTALAGQLAPARANPEKVQRVLFNLIQNAIRHTPADGSVTVLAEGAGPVVEIEVADTGCGIPAGARSSIFEAFTRAETAGGRDGAGLGLAIARAIVEAHGGRIWLADAAQGTRVRFSLPCA